jgi:hypothetical protein
MGRNFGSYEFRQVGTIEPTRNSGGEIVEEIPHPRYLNAAGLQLNKYGAGPFCRFQVARRWRSPGVYIITAVDLVLYVGECEDLEARYGANGYGGISPRNCFKGGQETNCRLNCLILGAAKQSVELCLWFLEVQGGKAERVKVETLLITLLKPAWNRQRAAS